MATATATFNSFTPRTDEEIQRDVLAELKWDARVQPNEIGVAAKDGIVTLTGAGGVSNGVIALGRCAIGRKASQRLSMEVSPARSTTVKNCA